MVMTLLSVQTFQNKLKEIRDQFLEPLEPGTPKQFPSTPAHINNGFCADFATIVWEQLERHPDIIFHDDEEMTGGEHQYSHTFLEFNDKFYDAECVKGTEDWTELPIFQR